MRGVQKLRGNVFRKWNQKQSERNLIYGFVKIDFQMFVVCVLICSFLVKTMSKGAQIFASNWRPSYNSKGKRVWGLCHKKQSSVSLLHAIPLNRMSMQLRWLQESAWKYFNSKTSLRRKTRTNPNFLLRTSTKDCVHVKHHCKIDRKLLELFGFMLGLSTCDRDFVNSRKLTS